MRLVFPITGLLVILSMESFCQQPQEIRNMNGKIDQIIGSLSLDEKIALLHGSGKFTSSGIPRLGLKEIQYTDGPLGIREEISRDSWNPVGLTTDSATFFPASSALAATWNPLLAYEYGAALGSEARARDKDVLLAPAINIIRSPLCGRNYEYFSEDPVLIARMVVPYIQGVQSQNIAACVKHYAINNQETNRGSIDVRAGERTIREIYLPGFKAAVCEGHCLAVMGAYNKFREQYLCENEYLLNTVLKKEWGFQGIVVSDWGAVHSTVESAMAGLDIEMGTEVLSYNDYYFGHKLAESVKSGKVAESVINDKVRRILRVLYNCKVNQPERSRGAINTREHEDLVYRVASEAVVLLKNSKGLLPLVREQIRSVAVIGDNATETFASGGFGAGVKARYEITLLDGLKERLGKKVSVRFAQGYKEQYLTDLNNHEMYNRPIDHRPDTALIAEAARTAAACDYAIVAIGSNRRVDSEAADRPDMLLPFGQVELVKAVTEANPNTIVVVVAGGPFDMTAVDREACTILWSWFNGSENGNALADVILGKVNPSGKLPYTIPKKLSDSPAHALHAFPGDKRKVDYDEGILVGYRWFDTRGIEPMFAFGYGLSYTTFSISGCKAERTGYHQADQIHLTCNIANTGSRAGSEVVQAYVHALNSAVTRPDKELKAFQKVNLNPGMTAEIELIIPVSDLAYYDETRNDWVIEPGTYEIRIGTSSGSTPEKVLILISEN